MLKPELEPGFNPLPSNVTEVKCLGPRTEYNIDTRHTMKCSWEGAEVCDSKHENGATLHGLASCVPQVLGKCKCNMKSALVDRHLKPRNDPKIEFAESKSWFSTFEAQLKEAYAQMAVELGWDEWWAKWTIPKQRMLLQSQMAHPIRRDRCKAMIKRELYAKDIKKARMIQFYRNGATQLETALEITRAQKAFCRVFNGQLRSGGIDVCFASGMTNRGIAQWMEETLTRCEFFYERDGAAWDATMGDKHYELKCWLYRMFDPKLADTMWKYKDTQSTIYTPDGSRIWYKTSATTKSGHNDTSLGNSIINAMISVQVMLQCGLRGRIIVMGDDLLMATTTRPDLEECQKIERDAGINPESAVFSDYKRVSFISGQWYPGQNGLIFAPKLSSVLDKLFWTTKQWPQKRVAQIVNGIVHGAEPTMGGFPIIGRFLAAHKTGCGVDLRAVQYSFAQLYTSHESVDREAMMNHYCSRYGVLPSEVCELEDLIMQNAGKVGVIQHPVIDIIRSVENADIECRPSRDY